MAECAGAGRHQETRSRRTCSSRSGRPTSTLAPQSRRACRSTSAERLDAVRERPAEPQGRPPAHQRRLLASQAAAISRRRGEAPGCAVRARAVQVAPRGFQRAGRCMCPASPLSVEFNIFGLERYALTYDNRALRNTRRGRALRRRRNPDERDEVRRRRDFQSAIDRRRRRTSRPAYVFIHELAHNLAGLGDEYVGSVTYETGAPVKVEPWEPNITALHDPSALKWRDLVEPGTPFADAAVVRGQSRRIRRRGIRSARSLSARGHVHHGRAHSRPLLPRLPAGDQSHHRSAHQ